jgi:two-component system, chemotaxis family, chemotaxis protein CheY
MASVRVRKGHDRGATDAGPLTLRPDSPSMDASIPMSAQVQIPGGSPDVPSVVLFVDDDADTLDMYSTYFELAGMSVAKSRTPADALKRVADLRPDLVVTDLGFAGQPDGVQLVEALKGGADTQNVPVIVLSGQSAEHVPAEVLRRADLCLVKPVLPDALLMDVQRLIALSHTLRDRCQRARARAAELAGDAEEAAARPQPPDSSLQAGQRPCPQCGDPLEWIEQGCIGAAHYDYFRWCARGCGLYCFDRGADTWLKLV